MTVRDDFDRLLTVWLDETAGAGAPDYLDETLDSLAHIGQRPAWMSPGRWLPMQLQMTRADVPRLVPILLMVALLIAAIVAAALIAGAPRPLPPPFGLAENGRIAYVSDGQIWTVRTDGSDPQAMTSDAAVKGVPFWSRDGTKLAFLSHVDPQRTELASLVVMDADASRSVTIIADAVALRHIAWSPDGTSLAFSRWIPVSLGQRDRIFTAKPDGSEPPTQIGDPGLSAFYPAYSPDGLDMAYVSDHHLNYCEQGNCVVDNTFALHIMSSDGSDDLTLARDEIQPKIDIDRYARIIDWKPDGSSILFTGLAAESGDYGIYTVAPDGTTVPRRIDDSAASAYGATWDPLGDRIAYLRERGDRWDLVVADADGGSARVIATDVGRFGPRWSPDGRSVIVMDPVEDERGSFRIVPVDGAGPVRTVYLTVVAPTSTSAPGVDSIDVQRLAP